MTDEELQGIIQTAAQTADMLSQMVGAQQGVMLVVVNGNILMGCTKDTTSQQLERVLNNALACLRASMKGGAP